MSSFVVEYDNFDEMVRDMARLDLAGYSPSRVEKHQKDRVIVVEKQNPQMIVIKEKEIPRLVFVEEVPRGPVIGYVTSFEAGGKIHQQKGHYDAMTPIYSNDLNFHKFTGYCERCCSDDTAAHGYHKKVNGGVGICGYSKTKNGKPCQNACGPRGGRCHLHK